MTSERVNLHATAPRLHSEQGDTAPPAEIHQRIEGRHDELEDAILDKIDIERGHAFDIVARRWRPTATDGGMKGVRVTVERAQVAFLTRFIERLVHIMSSVPADGGGSATRAYVIAKEMQVKARYTDADTIEVLMSPDGARAFGTELDAFLPKSGSPHNLASLRDAILAAIAPREAGRRTRGRRNRRNGR